MSAFWSQLDHTIKQRLPVVSVVVLAAVIGTAAVSTPARRAPGYAPAQPVAFSHAQHAGDMRIDCQYCHIGASRGRYAGIPAVGVCMNCHGVAAVDSAAIVRVREYYAAAEPIPWQRLHRVPQYAYFAHDAHMTAGLDCADCHGRVERMETLTQVMQLSMGSCLGCHRNVQERVPGVAATVRGPENCSACHR